MNHAQQMNEIRKELALNERLADLIKQAAREYANIAFREQYGHNEYSLLLKSSGFAHGVEAFVKDITKPPKRPANDD